MKLDTAKVRRLCAEKFGSKPGDAKATHGQTALAKCCDISPVTLSRLLCGHSQPLAGTLAALVGALLGEDGKASDLLEANEYAQPGDDW